MVSERGIAVLRAIVEDYVASREPVGSKTIVDRHPFGVSAATIRNDMAALEDEQLIVAPHTSSGRVPTDKGYRMYVDHLTELRPLTAAQRQAITVFLGESVDLDDVLTRTVRLLSQLTNQVALVQYPTSARARVRHIELVPLGGRRLLTVVITDTGQVQQRMLETTEEVDEGFVGELRARLNTAASGLVVGDAAEVLRDAAQRFPVARQAFVGAVGEVLAQQAVAHRQDRLLLSGTANLARSEQDFPGTIFPVLEAIEEQVTLLRLIGEMQTDAPVDGHGVAVRIGRENEQYGLPQASVVGAEYGADGALARVGLLGPTRMDYPTSMATVRAVARYLSRILGD